MKITREADYALRIIFMLSKKQKQFEARVIAENNSIPYRFTLKILRKLVQAKLVRSYRGVNGGYILNRPPSEISLFDVMECIDGAINLNRCGADAPNDSGAYTINLCLSEVQNKLEGELKKVTFDKIIQKNT